MIDITLAELRGRPDQCLDAATGAARHLGALVRPLQGARPGAREARGRLRRPLQAGQAQQRRAARDRRPAEPDLRRALHPVLRDVQRRPAGRRLRRRAARGADARLPRQARAQRRRSRQPRKRSTQAEELLAEGDTESALDKLQEAVAIDPANDAARYDYLRALLKAGRVAEARRAFEPVASKAIARRRAWPRSATGWPRASSAPSGAQPPKRWPRRSPPTSATSRPASSWRRRHFAARRFTQAMDELLEIVMRDKAWNGELARKTYVAILELMSKPAPKPAADTSRAQGRARSRPARSAAAPRRSGGRSVPAQAEHGAVLSAGAGQPARACVGSSPVSASSSSATMRAVARGGRRSRRCDLLAMALRRVGVAQRRRTPAPAARWPAPGHRCRSRCVQGLLGGRRQRRSRLLRSGRSCQPAPGAIGQQAGAHALQAVGQVVARRCGVEQRQRLGPAGPAR